jgi:histidinol dehydrogenase
MKTILFPDKNSWREILQRPVIDQPGLIDSVKPILADVKSNGDEAVKRYTLQFDKVAIASLKVNQEEIDDATRLLPSALRKAIDMAAENIRRFHEKQCTQTEIIETMPGIKCWRRSVAIEKVGLYIPGGTAPLFSTVLMLGIPAKIAGCIEII